MIDRSMLEEGRPPGSKGDLAVFRSKCHEGAGMQPAYDFASGILILTCALCGAKVVEFAIAVSAEKKPAHVLSLAGKTKPRKKEKRR